MGQETQNCQNGRYNGFEETPDHPLKQKSPRPLMDSRSWASSLSGEKSTITVQTRVCSNIEGRASIDVAHLDGLCRQICLGFPNDAQGVVHKRSTAREHIPREASVAVSARHEIIVSGG
jgi:hypothetical protein